MEWWAFGSINEAPLLFGDIIEVREIVRSNENAVEMPVDLMIAGLIVTRMHIGLVGQRTYTRWDARFRSKDIDVSGMGESPWKLMSESSEVLNGFHF